jgi:general L-amino acid transport system permease protein
MAVDAQAPPAPASVPFYNDPKIRGLVYQVALFVIVLGLGYVFVLNARDNLRAAKIATGFGFLENTAGFGINQTLIPYSEADSYGRVFLVGLLNTLLVAGLGIVLATVLGFLIGIARLSKNWLLQRLAGGYVELIRNLPLLFQILFWYLAVLGAMPGPRQSIGLGLQPIFQGIARFFQWLAGFGLPGAFANVFSSIADWIGPPGLFLNNRGLIAPRPVFGDGSGVVVALFIAGIIATFVVRSWARRRQMATGQQFPVGWTALGLIIGLPLVAMVAAGFPITLDRPALRGFNFAGGITVIPELFALLVALVTYTAAFIAEIVRSGIMAVSHGQTEAAYSLGLRGGPTLRLVVIPQALRVIIPPLTSQYLNLTKNSSLAVGIGYPDLFAVFAGTTLNQTGQAIEVIAITMAVYLVISLATSSFMNWYNARVRLVER